MFDRINRDGLSGPHPVSGNRGPDLNPIKNRLSYRGIAPFLVVTSALLCIGCSSTTTPGSADEEIRTEGRLVFEGGAGDADPTGTIYTIRLADVPPALESRPELAIASVEEAVGAGVRVIRPDPSRPSMLVYGRYHDPLSERARADSKRIRGITVDEQAPFALAVMVKESDPRPSSGRLSRFDLRNVKGLLGDEAMYTLQIGVYTRDDTARPSRNDLAKFRESAEDAVEQLRRDGVEAFFYHGPTGSMVTVGTFNDGDLDTTVVPPIESTSLRQARAENPHNLLNGRGVRQTRRGGSDQSLQPSRLVLVPE